MPRGVQVNWLSGKKKEKETRGGKKALFCILCSFPWCKYFHQGRFQATKLDFAGVGKRRAWLAPVARAREPSTGYSASQPDSGRDLYVRLCFVSCDRWLWKGRWEMRTGLTSGQSIPAMPRTLIPLNTPSLLTPCKCGAPRLHVQPFEDHWLRREARPWEAAGPQAQILPLQFTRFEDLGILTFMSLRFRL